MDMASGLQPFASFEYMWLYMSGVLGWVIFLVGFGSCLSPWIWGVSFDTGIYGGMLSCWGVVDGLYGKHISLLFFVLWYNIVRFFFVLWYRCKKYGSGLCKIILFLGQSLEVFLAQRKYTDKYCPGEWAANAIHVVVESLASGPLIWV